VERKFSIGNSFIQFLEKIAWEKGTYSFSLLVWIMQGMKEDKNAEKLPDGSKVKAV